MTENVRIMLQNLEHIFLSRCANIFFRLLLYVLAWLIQIKTAAAWVFVVASEWDRQSQYLLWESAQQSLARMKDYDDEKEEEVKAKGSSNYELWNRVSEWDYISTIMLITPHPLERVEKKMF
jgi:hypothetical protein